MSTESNRQTDTPSPTAQPTDLKASDFFPPGEGWNQDEPQPQATEIRPEACDEQRGKN